MEEDKVPIKDKQAVKSSGKSVRSHFSPTPPPSIRSFHSFIPLATQPLVDYPTTRCIEGGGLERKSRGKSSELIFTIYTDSGAVYLQ